MPRLPKDDGSFLGRWSRNKRAQPVDKEPVAEVAPVPEPENEAGSLTQEEVAALPAIDDLTPQTDISVFLQKGVPQALRNAALRRKWMLVPGIRDHKDPAVDYAWDWNTPGGVPGDGFAPSPERAAQMLHDLFAPRNDPAMPPPDTSQVLAESPMPAQDAVPAVQQIRHPEDRPSAARPTNTRPSGPDQADTGQKDGVAADPSTFVRRRHGGALPQ